MNETERLLTIEELEKEMDALYRDAEILQSEINEFKDNGEMSNFKCQIAFAYIKAKRKHLNILRQQCNRLRKLANYSTEDKRLLRVPTFNHHFYLAAKDILSEEQLEMISNQAQLGFEQEKMERKIDI